MVFMDAESFRFWHALLIGVLWACAALTVWWAVAVALWFRRRVKQLEAREQSQRTRKKGERLAKELAGLRRRH